MLSWTRRRNRQCSCSICLECTQLPDTALHHVIPSHTWAVSVLFTIACVQSICAHTRAVPHLVCRSNKRRQPPPPKTRWHSLHTPLALFSPCAFPLHTRCTRRVSSRIHGWCTSGSHTDVIYTLGHIHVRRLRSSCWHAHRHFPRNFSHRS